MFVDLVNTVSRDNVSFQSNQILLRVDTTFFTLKLRTMRGFCRGTIVTQLLSLLLLCIPIHQNCLVICMPYRKQATLVLNEGGDDWSPWNDRMKEIHGMIVVQKCKKCLSEIVH